MVDHIDKIRPKPEDELEDWNYFKGTGMFFRLLPFGLPTSIFGLPTFLLTSTIMKQHIAHIALVVADYDEAIQFYTTQLNFRLIEDTVLSETKRWVLVAPPGSAECCLLLAKAANEEQQTRVGNQTGGRVFMFLYTDDFHRDHKAMQEKGIIFVRDTVMESYGTVAVFKDLYGNLWDLIEPKK
jgi:catechol 2,3-dioxygenase-like lactoylglutathione lyase family enzyme